jgi:hypothetical protein
LFCSQELAS